MQKMSPKNSRETHLNRFPVETKFFQKILPIYHKLNSYYG